MIEDQKLDYYLDHQVGFLLRKASQRNSEVFSTLMSPELTPTRFAALAKLYEIGPLSQNELGRQTAMDVATIKGVVERLGKLGFVITAKDPNDGRKHVIRLTTSGKNIFLQATESAFMVSEKTLESLTKAEVNSLTKLLEKIC